MKSQTDRQGILHKAGPICKSSQQHKPQIQTPAVAFPRNFLHIQLLEENLPEVDYILYREAFMRPRLDKGFPPNKLIDIGREMRLGINGWDISKIIGHNRTYYPQTLNALKNLNPQTIIIFLENEPLEVALMDYFGMDKFELWEEGVMHYVDMFNPLFFRTRRLAQIATGFYSKHPFRARIDRSQVTIRDRFDKKNLNISTPQGAGLPRAAIAFIANVMVGDGLTTKAAYLSALKKLADLSALPIVYLPHPRECRGFIKALETELSHPNLTIETPTQGTLQYCVDYAFSTYISPFSTTLLDLRKFDNSFWVPEYFGLKSYTKALKQTDIFPVKLLSPRALEARLKPKQ